MTVTTRLLLRSCSSVPRTSLSRRLYAAVESREAYLEHGKGEDEGITYLTLDRPAARNALSVKLLRELGEAIDEVRFSPTTRALILRSSQTGTFCAGADLKERKSMSQDQVARFLYDLRRIFSACEDLPMPTIAAVDGPALGGGLELALCCDLRVAGASVDKLGLTETKLGIIPGAGGTQRLSRLLGPASAKDLIFTARILDAPAALKLGLVNHIAAPGQSASDRATELAREIVPSAPLAVRAAKQAIDTGSQLDLESGLDLERACYATILLTQDRLEGLKAFAEKRKPVFKGQ